MRRRTVLWLAVALSIAAWLTFFPRPLSQDEKATVSVAVSRPTIAVAYFANLTGQPDLDWLRLGLVDLLVTDLSQSASLRVVGTERLFRLVGDPDLWDASGTIAVRDLASKTQATVVLQGTYTMSGEVLRIELEIWYPGMETFSAAESVQGKGLSSAFASVDELTRRVHNHLGVTTPEGADRSVEELTTASLEAYRDFVEGSRRQWRGHWEEALGLLDRALTHDPRFTRALVLLAMMYQNLGHREERDSYAARALQDLDRLTAAEGQLLEGWYFSLREETLGRAIEAYETLLVDTPDHGQARNNLALCFRLLERFDEAIGHLEELRRQRYAYFGTYSQLARCYAHLGDFEKAQEILLDWLSENPTSAIGYRILGLNQTRWGKLDEALASFAKVESLSVAGDLWSDFGRWDVFILREDWNLADELAARMEASPDPTWARRGTRRRAVRLLYHGFWQEAVSLLVTAAGSQDAEDPSGAATRAYAAHVWLERGDARQALQWAQRAQVEGQGDSTEWEGLFYAALAHARLGDWDEAERTARTLRHKADSIPTEKEKRRYEHLVGELALARGDASLAIQHLERAQKLLPVRDFPTERLPPHVPIWYALGLAHLAADRLDGAQEWFERIIESTTEHTWWPIDYVRSFYFLGIIHESRGETSRANEYFRHFIQFWKEGDLDRGRVAEVEGKLGRVKEERRFPS